MEGILKFDLNDTEEEMALRRHLKSKDMAILIFEITHNMRKHCYNICDQHNDFDKYKGVDTVFDRIDEIIDDLYIDINDLIN